MPLPLLIPFAAAASYSTGTLVASVVSVGAVSGVTGGFLGWYVTKKDNLNDDQIKIDDITNQRMDNAKKEVDHIASKAKNLKDKITLLDEKKNEILIEMNEFRTEVNENKETLDHHKNALNHVKEALAEQTIKLEECVAEIAALKSKLEESQNFLGEKNTCILKAQQELMRLGNLATSQTQTIDSLTTQLLELSKDNELLRKDRDQYKRFIDEDLTPKIGVLLQKVGMYQKKNATPPLDNDPNLGAKNVLSL